MAAPDEARAQLTSAINAWDFSVCFPGGYTGIKAVMVVPEFPYDVIDNMLQENHGQMTQPIISVGLEDDMDTFRTLGGKFSQTQIATRVGLAFIIMAWADQFMGGYDTAEKLIGQVQGCLFYNRISLAAYRHLRTHSVKTSLDERTQMWVGELVCEGDALLTIG